jgi:thiol:disulfide interchange protein DsbD
MQDKNETNDNFFIGIYIRSYFSRKCSAQSVNWTFTSKKIADKTYEIHLTANVQSGWHLFSQVQPEDAVANPTEFKINSNPLVTLNGKIKEMGTWKNFMMQNWTYRQINMPNKVDFVQLVKLKNSVKQALQER